MSATTNRRSRAEIVKAIAAVVGAIVMPGQNDPTVKAFEKVELFDSEDLPAAFQFLTVVEQRVALIVPMDEEFEDALKLDAGKVKHLWRRKCPVIVICSDRVMGDRKATLFGKDDGSEIGAEGLVELVLPAVSGQLLPGGGNVSGVVCEPKMISTLTVKNTETELPGRVAVGVEFECRGGVLEARLDKGPIF